MTTSIIRSALRTAFPNAEGLDDNGDGSYSTRDWSFSKESEDITYEETEREREACKRFAELAPGWAISRGDKNYFEIWMVAHLGVVTANGKARLDKTVEKALVDYKLRTGQTAEQAMAQLILPDVRKAMSPRQVAWALRMLAK